MWVNNALHGSVPYCYHRVLRCCVAISDPWQSSLLIWQRLTLLRRTVVFRLLPCPGTVFFTSFHVTVNAPRRAAAFVAACLVDFFQYIQCIVL
jgi:hypothetical protein